MMKYLFILLIVLSVALSGQNYFDQRSFHDIFGRACGEIHNLPNGAINQPNTVNAYKVGIIGQFDIPGYGVKEVFTRNQPAVILNFGSRFEYAVYSQPIPAIFEKRILEELEELREDFLEEYDDINASWTYEKGQILLTANYPYTDADGGDIKNRLVFLMRSSQKLVETILSQYHYARFDRREELEDMELKFLSRLDLNILLPREKLEEWAKEVPGVTEGAYGYTLKGIDMEVRNYGGHIELIYEDRLPEGADEKLKEMIIHRLSDAANDTGSEGNPVIAVETPADLPANIWVKFDYTFDGSFTGDEFTEYFEAFGDDFLPEIDMRYDEIKEDIRDELMENNLTYLSRSAFELITDDNLSGHVSKELKGEEGAWGFTREDKYNYEIINSGKKITFINWLGVPKELDEESYNKILERSKEIINDEQPEGAVLTEIGWYEGYENQYLKISAVYEINGAYNGETLAGYYREYIDDYSREKHEKILEIIDNLN